jgi:hypothetical protein
VCVWSRECSCREAEARQQAALKAQRAEMEGAIERHLGFIDELIVDKKGLMERVTGELLAGERARSK